MNLSLLLQILAPILPVDSYRVGIVGDNQNGPAIFSQITATLARERINLLVSVGDCIQNRGAFPQEWATQWLAPMANLQGIIPTLGAPGNHDDPLGFQMFVSPLPAHLPGNLGLWGATTVGSIRMLFLDANQESLELRTSMMAGGPQRAWLEQQVTSPEWIGARWRMAFWHQPVDTSLWDGTPPCYYPRNDVAHAPWVWAMDRLAAAGCHATWHGHAHGRQRGAWLGMAMVITGGAGGALDHWCRAVPEITVAVPEHHAMVMDVEWAAINVKAIAPDGRILDQFRIN